MIQLPIEIGDTLLGGKFKNKRIVVKEIGLDEYGSPTVNGRSILKVRIPKLYKKMDESTMKSNYKEAVEQFQKLPITVKIKKQDKRFCLFLQTVDGEECLNTVGYETKELAQHAALTKGFTVDGYEPPTNVTKTPMLERLIREIILEAQLKVSRAYWESLTEIEKNYILSRWPKNSLSTLKTIISAARKQLPNFDKIYGAGIVEKDGKKYYFSGLDTKKFYRVDNDGNRIRENINELDVDVTDAKIETAINELSTLESKLAAAKAQIAALEKELGIEAMEKQYAKIVNEDLGGLLDEMKKDEVRIVRTKTVLMEIKRFQAERATFSHEKVLDFAMTQVNQDVKFKILQELKATEKITKIKPSLSFSKRESVLREAGLLGRAIKWISTSIKGLLSKLKPSGQKIDVNLDKLERILKIK